VFQCNAELRKKVTEYAGVQKLIGQLILTALFAQADSDFPCLYSNPKKLSGLSFPCIQFLSLIHLEYAGYSTIHMKKDFEVVIGYWRDSGDGSQPHKDNYRESFLAMMTNFRNRC
jgi:hypothetical protein